jgi:hypothetical protein
MLENKNLNIQVPAGKTSIIIPYQCFHSTTTGSLTKEQEAVSAAAVDSTSPTTGLPSKEQQAVSAAVAMNYFKETVNPKDYQTLDSTRKAVSRRIKTSHQYFVVS